MNYMAFKRKWWLGKPSKLKVFITQTGSEMLTWDIENAPIVASTCKVGKKYKIVQKRDLTRLEMYYFKSHVNKRLEDWCRSDFEKQFQEFGEKALKGKTL